jgi:hypothetical protein
LQLALSPEQVEDKDNANSNNMDVVYSRSNNNVNNGYDDTYNYMSLPPQLSMNDNGIGPLPSLNKGHESMSAT